MKSTDLILDMALVSGNRVPHKPVDGRCLGQFEKVWQVYSLNITAQKFAKSSPPQYGTDSSLNVSLYEVFVGCWSVLT